MTEPVNKETRMRRIMWGSALALLLVLFVGCNRTPVSTTQPEQEEEKRSRTDDSRSGRPGSDDPSSGRTKMVAVRFTRNSAIKGGVTSIAVSPDGAFIVTMGSGDRGNLEIWDVAGMQKVRTIDNPSGSILPVAVAPDGKSFAYATVDERVVLRDLPGGNELRVLEAKVSQGRLFFISGLAFSPKGDLLVVAGEKHLVGFDPRSGEQRFAWKPESDKVSALSPFFAGGSRIASGSDKGKVTVWNVPSGEARLLEGDLSSQVVDLAPSPDGKTLVAVPLSGSLAVFDVAAGKRTKSLAVKGGWLPARFLPDGVTLLYGKDTPASDPGGPASDVVLENVTTGARTHLLRGHTKAICLALTPDGSTAVTGSEDGTIRVWDLKKLP
jgi:WD40 repeat protein